MSGEARSVTVSAVVQSAGQAGFDLEVLAGEAGLERRIDTPYPQKTGLALAGFDRSLQTGRLLVFGESEVRYLEALEEAPRLAALARVFAHGIPCVLLTKRLEPPPDLMRAAAAANIPLLRTSLPTPRALAKLTSLLDDRLSPRAHLHGVLLDILGLGLLVVGESGIGKSECALELVGRGHRLVADDVVEVRRRAESVIIGTCPALTRHHMEVRGIGLINVKDLFGVAATRTSKRVELVVQLERWDQGRDYERLGLDESYFEVLGVPVSTVRMPVAPGRNLAILVEVAARNHLLRTRGEHAARQLAARLDQQLRDQAAEPEGAHDDVHDDAHEEAEDVE
jgi:HPr kinase/phosphorylase